MGIIEKLLRPTPFYKSYKKYLQKKNERIQEETEEKFHPLRVKFYKQFLNHSDTVFDVGANVGNRVSAFLDCGARVIAVEPQPQCVKILNAKFANKIIIEQVGVGDTTGELEMHISTDSTISSFNQEYINNTKERFKYSKWVDTIKVPITTLDNLIAKHGTPKFCKIDVEGFELQVLTGLHSPIPFLSIEYCVPEMKNQLNDCLSYLSQLTPSGKFNYSKGESMVWAFENWFSFEEFSKHVNTTSFMNSSFGDIYFRANEFG